MKRKKASRVSSIHYSIVCAVAVVGIGWALLAGAEGPSTPKVSRFAPAKDLTSQIDFYLGRLQESLANREDFDEAKQSRVRKDANTLAVLALALGMHDEKPDRGVSSAGLIHAAQALAESNGDYDRAAASLADARKSLEARTADAGHLKWEKVASLEALMKQVPIVHAGLKRGIEGRFQRQAEQSAGQAATLAAIAAEALFDTSDVKNPADAAPWRRFCSEMRDAAGEINSAAHAGDQAAARAGLVRLSKSCDACHAVFRQEK